MVYTEALIKQSPYFVTIRRNDGNEIWGGAIISPQHVLTSYHCMIGKNYTKNADLFVHAGTLSDNFGKGSIHLVKRVKVYRKKINDDSFQIHNLALLELEKPIEFDKTRQSIRLFGAGKPKSPLVGSLVGYGPKSRQNFSLQILKSQDCNWAYGEEIVKSFQFCAGHVKDNEIGPKSCVKNEVGPLVVNGELAGIFSYNLICESNMHISIFTNIGSYRKWIHTYAGIK